MKNRYGKQVGRSEPVDSLSEAVVHRCCSKYVFLKISQFSQEKVCVGKTLQHGCFPVKILKLLRTPVFTEHLWWLVF